MVFPGLREEGSGLLTADALAEGPRPPQLSGATSAQPLAPSSPCSRGGVAARPDWPAGCSNGGGAGGRGRAGPGAGLELSPGPDSPLCPSPSPSRARTHRRHDPLQQGPLVRAVRRGQEQGRAERGSDRGPPGFVCARRRGARPQPASALGKGKGERAARPGPRRWDAAADIAWAGGRSLLRAARLGREGTRGPRWVRASPPPPPAPRGGSAGPGTRGGLPPAPPPRRGARPQPRARRIPAAWHHKGPGRAQPMGAGAAHRMLIVSALPRWDWGGHEGGGGPRPLSSAWGSPPPAGGSAAGARRAALSSLGLDVTLSACCFHARAWRLNRLLRRFLTFLTRVEERCFCWRPLPARANLGD